MHDGAACPEVKMLAKYIIGNKYGVFDFLVANSSILNLIKNLCLIIKKK